MVDPKTRHFYRQNVGLLTKGATSTESCLYFPKENHIKERVQHNTDLQ